MAFPFGDVPMPVRLMLGDQDSPVLDLGQVDVPLCEVVDTDGRPAIDVDEHRLLPRIADLLEHTARQLRADTAEGTAADAAPHPG